MEDFGGEGVLGIVVLMHVLHGGWWCDLSLVCVCGEVCERGMWGWRGGCVVRRVVSGIRP